MSSPANLEYLISHRNPNDHGFSKRISEIRGSVSGRSYSGLRLCSWRRLLEETHIRNLRKRLELAFEHNLPPRHAGEFDA